MFGVIAILGCAIDLWTKEWVFQWRGWPRPGNEWWIIENYVGIETAMNPGALFGMGAGGGAFFAGLSIVAAAGIVGWLFFAKAAHDWWLTIALALVMGGIHGNLYDRLGLAYEAGMPPEWGRAVRDWILICWHDYKWPNFNIADSLLVCGATMLVWHAARPPEGEAAADK